MLVASRDPHHSGPNDPAPGSRFARTMGAVQIAGALLAIPVGVGSAYTMYRSNFTVEASCQTLRANIIQILDKSVDASARHMLVRRDVEAFEQTCGTVDPDAAAAFKTLLTADKTPAQAAPVLRRIEAQPKQAEKPVERKVEAKTETKTEVKVAPRQETVAKPPVAKPAAVVAAPVPAHRDPATSDTAWLEAVRGALVNRGADQAPAVEAATPPVAEPKAVEPKAVEAKAVEPKATEAKAVEPKTAVAAPVAVAPVAREIAPLNLDIARTAPVVAPAPVPDVAPALPPATSIAATPEPQAPATQAQTRRADANHPVPPGEIPETAPPAQEQSRIGALISHIPFVGRVLDR